MNNEIIDNSSVAGRQININRWRLVLGSFSDQSLDFCGSVSDVDYLLDMEELLDYLYSRSQDEDIRSEHPEGGQGGTVLSAAEWITRVRVLFPRQTAEVLEKQALDEFHMTELLTDSSVLEKMTPNMELLKTVLSLKHLMKGEVLLTARKIAKQVADELRARLEVTVQRSFIGQLDRSSQSPVHSARNLDIPKTIRKNLKHYDPVSETLVLKDIYFSNRVKKRNKKRIIIAIDESGSMTGSIIYSAVMAQIFSSLPFADVRLVIFDTSLVDLSEHVDDPVQILMSVQLGGGTNIAMALDYCEQLIATPADTVVLVITDLYEGGSTIHLMNTSRNIILSGARLNFLTALDEKANASYDRNLGQKLANMGAFVGALTPDQLGDYVGRLFN